MPRNSRVTSNREFYPEGALKSESEIKNGKRHGKYREYYETGELSIRGE
jgi:antitoxin component YwqK of YwqJK toxin-antitoxin module